MKVLFSFFFISVFLFSCNDKDDLKHKTSCGNSTYIEDQEWFQKTMEECSAESVCKLSVHKGIYRDDTVYYTGLGGPLCDPIFHVVLLDCQGDTIREYNWEDKDAFEKEFTYIGLIAECPDN